MAAGAGSYLRQVRRLLTRPSLLLAGICAASFLVRLLAAWGKSEPIYFPDEYIYPELARHILHGSMVREVHAGIYALLTPLITSPFWSEFSPHVAYRLVQSLNSLLFSLAAVPAYMLSRRLGASTWLSLGVAAVSVAGPDLVFAGYSLLEPAAYLVFLASVWVGTEALALGDRRRQAAFVALSGLCVLARTQLIVVPAAYLAATIALGLLEKDLRVLRRQWLSWSAFLLVGVAATAVKGSAALGAYSAAVNWRPHVLGLLSWMGRDLYVLLWSSGLVLLPCCLIAVAWALWRPRRREQRAFALLFLPLAVLLLAQGAYFPSAGGDFSLQEIHERYFFYLAPLAAIGFTLFVSAGLARSRVAQGALVVLALLTVVTVQALSLSSLAGLGIDNSPFLTAVEKLDLAIGGLYMSVPYLAALATALMMALAVIVHWRASALPAFALGSAGLVLVLSSVSATAAIDQASGIVQRDVFGDQGDSWLARMPSGTPLVTPPISDRIVFQDLLYWRPSLLPAALDNHDEIDDFGFQRATIAPDGSLLVDGRNVDDAVLVLSSAIAIPQPETERLASLPQVAAWRHPRFAFLVEGYYRKVGWLANRGWIGIWPAEPFGRLSGVLRFPVTGARTSRMRFESDGRKWSVRLSPVRHWLEIPVCARGTWSLRFSVTGSDFFKGRSVVGRLRTSIKGPPPSFQKDPSACAH